MLYDNGYESDSDVEDYGEPAVSGVGGGIIVLAKQMCVIMMEMTDFTRGRGL